MNVRHPVLLALLVTTACESDPGAPTGPLEFSRGDATVAEVGAPDATAPPSDAAPGSEASAADAEVAETAAADGAADARTTSADAAEAALALAPSFDLPLLAPGNTLGAPLTEDGRVTRAELGGLPAVLAFWASWCSHCQEEMPDLDSTAGRYVGRVRFVAINTADTVTAAQTYLGAHSFPHLAFAHDEGSVDTAYGTEGYPALFLLDATGHVVDTRVGAQTAADLDALVAPVLATP